MITIVLDWPNPALMPNRSNGKHWSKTAAIRVKAKDDTYYIAKAAANGRKFPPGVKQRVFITFIAPDKRRRDLDGCLSSIKPHLDGIAKAIGIDDHLFGPVTLDYVTGDKPGSVIVTVGS
jgi:crossover junction endodeoxyribonuclease RusA